MEARTATSALPCLLVGCPEAAEHSRNLRQPKGTGEGLVLRLCEIKPSSYDSEGRVFATL